MDCIDCIQAGRKDFEKIDGNNCCHFVLIARMMPRKKECVNIVMKIAVKYALIIGLHGLCRAAEYYIENCS